MIYCKCIIFIFSKCKKINVRGACLCKTCCYDTKMATLNRIKPCVGWGLLVAHKSGGVSLNLCFELRGADSFTAWRSPHCLDKLGKLWSHDTERLSVRLVTAVKPAGVVWWRAHSPSMRAVFVRLLLLRSRRWELWRQ